MMGDNIFKTLRVAQDEVVMCRFLAGLLDPNGYKSTEDNPDTTFLESFLRDVYEMEDAELKGLRLEKTCVMTEYIIDKGKRIDIMLQHPQFSIPIEVKINAGDQEAQCYDYYSYASNAKLVYLTKNEETSPSLWSMQSGDKEDILDKSAVKCISWRKICDWLDKWSEKQPKTDKNAELLEHVRQYIETINWFLDNPKKQPANCSLACDVLDAFRKAIDGKAIAKTYQLEWLKDSHKSYCGSEWNEWNKNDKTDLQRLNFCPGVNYRVESIRFSEPRELWFRIEVSDDGYLVGGFCLVEKTGNNWKSIKVDDEAMEAVKERFPDFRVIASRSYWWFTWRYSNGKQAVSYDDVPNFKAMNQCAANLLGDNDKLEKFVGRTLQIFEDQLLEYLKTPCS